MPIFTTKTSIANRPMSQKDAQGVVDPEFFNYTAFQGDYSGTNLIYKGIARPGSSTSAAVWQICKLTYDVSNNVVSITWPQDASGKGNADFQFVWTNRASYTYS